MFRNHSVLYTAAIVLGVFLISSGIVNFASAFDGNQAAPDINEPVVIIREAVELPILVSEPLQTEDPQESDFLEPIDAKIKVENGFSQILEGPALSDGHRLEGNPSPDNLVDWNRNVGNGSLPQLLEEDPQVPVRLVIPSIELDTRVIPAEWEVVSLWGQELRRWLAPDEGAAGWHTTSALLGEPGNTVLNGHHNVYGEIFARLSEVAPGDVIKVYSEYHLYQYIVSNVMILSEKYEPLDVRLSNAAWIQPSTDERLTLITCWPPETNTHRVIVVAQPVK